MAVTVEELQIILSCDATTAEAVLQKIQTTVQAFVDKISGPLSSIGEKTGQAAKEINRQFSGIGKGNPLDSVSAAPVEKAAKSVTTVGKELDTVSEKARKALDSFKGDIDGDGFTKQQVTAERLAAAYKRLSVLRDKYDTEVEKNGEGSAKAVSIEGSIASTKNQIVTLTEQLEKLRTKFSEVRSEAEGLSGIDWSQVTITGDTGQQHSDKPIIPQYQPEPFQPYTATGNDPAVFMQTQVDNMSQSVARMMELAGEARAKIEDAFSGGDIDTKLASNLSLAERKIREFANQLQSVSAAKGADSGAALSVEGKLQSAINKADTLLAKLEKIRGTSNVSGYVSPEEDSGTTSMPAKAGMIASALAKVESAATSAGASIRSAFNTSHIGKFTSRLNRMISRMLTMRLVRFVLNGVSSGFETLSQSSESSAAALNALKASSSAVGVSIATAVMPIIKALVPLFYQVASAALAAANAIAAFFAAITGQGRFTAVSMKKNMESIEKSAGGGGGALKGLLADFDELNVIASDAGGGGGGGGLGNLFDVEEDQEIPEWAKWIQEHMDSMKAAALAIGAALAAWKISEAFGAGLQTALGLALSIGGAVAYVYGWLDSWNTGIDWENLVIMLSGAAAAVAGLTIAFSAVAGAIGAFVSGIGLAVVAIKNWIKSGELADTTFSTLEWGLAAVAVGFAMLGGPIGVVIAAIAALALAVYKYWNEISAALGIAGVYIATFFRGIVTLVTQIVGKVGAIIQIGIDGILIGVLWLVQQILEAIGWIFPGASEAAAKVGDTISDLAADLEAQKEKLAEPIDISVLWTPDEEGQKQIAEYKKALSQTIVVPIRFRTVEKADIPYGQINAQPFASGGLVYGDTLARIGEYPGARNNPEVVAPLSDLRGILRGTGSSDGMTRTQADTMIGLLRQVAAKDLTIGPSADLGQVVTRSLEAYGTV